jgi:hypothetical protein
MEGSGIREPEPGSHAEHSVVPEADDAANEPLGALIAGLSDLSEDELLCVIGAYEVTPDQRLGATIHRYAPEVAASIEGVGMAARADVDLVALGRRRVQRVLEDWGESLKPRVCDLWHKRVPERELALNIANALTLLLSVVAAVLAAIALAIARYGLEKLCGPRTKTAKTYYM